MMISEIKHDLGGVWTPLYPRYALHHVAKKTVLMSPKPQSLQDSFLNACRKDKVQVTVYLNHGVKLQGVVHGFDNFCVMLRRSNQLQLVYKHGIATIVPSEPVELGRDGGGGDARDSGSLGLDESGFEIA